MPPGDVAALVSNVVAEGPVELDATMEKILGAS